jgi:hypothetical protein
MTRPLPVRIGPVDTATRLAALPAGQHGGPDAAARRDQLLLRQALLTHRRVCISPEAWADYDTRADQALARLDPPTVTAETTEIPAPARVTAGVRRAA